VVDQIRGLLGPIEAVAVKQEIGDAALGLSPKQAQEAIQSGVERAVREAGRGKPYRLTGPYTMVLQVREERPLYGSARRTNTRESTFTSSDLLEILAAFNAMK
jgi:D-aminopeptidase